MSCSWYGYLYSLAAATRNAFQFSVLSVNIRSVLAASSAKVSYLVGIQFLQAFENSVFELIFCHKVEF